MTIRTISAFSGSILLAATSTAFAGPMKGAGQSDVAAAQAQIQQVQYYSYGRGWNSGGVDYGSPYGAYGGYAYGPPYDAGYSVPYGAYYVFERSARHPEGVYINRSVGYRGWHNGIYYNGRVFR